MTLHARLSPSGAERWMTCSGSPRMEDRFPEETSEFSSEGTAAHEIRERCLREGRDVIEFVGEFVEADGTQFEVTKEWADWLQPGIDRIREFKGTWQIEYRVEMDPWIPEGFGTLDTGGVSPDLIIIDDLKFGRGVVVQAERNRQLMIYAIGFWKNYARHHTKATRFLLRIDQPRVAGGGSEWETTLEELMDFASEVAEAALATLDPDAPLTPTPDGCRFCKASRNSGCYALDQFVLALLGMELSDLDVNRTEEPTMVEYDEMDPERRSYLLAHAALIRSWLANLHAKVLNDALLGNNVPGFKAVGTLGDRAWTSEAEAEEFWKGKIPAKDLYTQKLKSPTQLEKLAGTRNWKKAEETIVHRPDGKPALVPESDPRPALIPVLDLLDDLEDDFDDIVETTADEADYLDDLI